MCGNSKVYIKKCSNKDIDTVLKIGIQSYKEHYSYLWKDDCSQYLNKTLSRNILEEDFNDTNIDFFLIEYNKEPVGITKIKKDNAVNSYLAKMSLELEKIYFINEVTGKGLGSITMNFIVDYAIKLNKKMLWLDVMANSPALQFYEKIGFEKSGETYLDLPFIKTEYNKMHVMTKLL